MKRNILLFGLAVVMTLACAMNVQAKSDDDLKTAIKLYKAGNYSACIQVLEPYLRRDPSNAVAHYYMAIANAQAGRVGDAINHYDTVINLNSQETLVRYATRGKLCLEDVEACRANESLDEFVRARRGFDVTNAVKHTIETQNLDSLRRDINDNKDIEPARLKKFKNFSSMNEGAVPSNDEIVAALRTLQQAGISAPVMSNPYSDMSAMFASSVNSGNVSAADNLMNLMSRMGGNGTSNGVDPRVLQTMMTSQMMGF